MYFGTITLLILIIPLFVVPSGIMKKQKPYKVILTSMAATSVLVMIALAAGQQGGQTLGEQFLAQIEKLAAIIAESEELAAQAGLGNMTVAEREKFIINVYGMVSVTLPAAVIITSTAYSYIIYKIMTFALKKQGKEVIEFTPLKYFRWPIHTLFGFFLMFLLSWALEGLDVFAGTGLSVNMNLIFEYVVALEGVCVILLMLSRYRIPRIVNGALVVFGLFTGIGRMMFFGIGVFEFIFGFGRYFPTRKK